ncbi:hypothetical protein H072_621 [Dactylellina haptotyla CBS 200.50]|uniref:RTA1 like protein n=1 Tax=Dactylellina haptotyla (strain CBS 200.50) TaxID=1284197 RepID=S8C0W8_DACHA|nr:hypothetical protein H072_621 [Dactylellina haptotyla CBS 200.50]
MAQLKPVDGTDYYLWKFLPSIPIALVFLFLFGVATVALSWRIYKTKTWYCIVFAVGGFFQVIGYGARIYCHWNTNLIGAYVVQSTFILLAPVLYAASIYMVLGRLVSSARAGHLSIVRPTRLTKIFVAGDILSLTVQGNAVSLTTKDKTKSIGEAIITAGLFIQLIVFGFFVIVALIFHKRMRKGIANGSEQEPDVPWRQGLRMLYACSVLIMVRSVFRVIEYIMGVDSYLLTTEWPGYVFDAALMVVVQYIFLVWFPHKFQYLQLENEEIEMNGVKRKWRSYIFGRR